MVQLEKPISHSVFKGCTPHNILDRIFYRHYRNMRMLRCGSTLGTFPASETYWHDYNGYCTKDGCMMTNGVHIDSTWVKFL